MDPRTDGDQTRDDFPRKQPSAQDETVIFKRSTCVHGLTGQSALRHSRSATLRAFFDSPWRLYIAR
jgi:hypothetical protein